jgi:hypothetical protein
MAAPPKKVTNSSKIVKNPTPSPSPGPSPRPSSSSSNSKPVFDPKRMYSSGLSAGTPGGDKNKVQMMQRAQALKQEREKQQKNLTTNKGDGKKPPIVENKIPLIDLPIDSGTTSEPIFELPPPPPQMVRVPERDVVSLAQETISAETITNLLFENVGANELTKFVRHDTVEGINPYYDVISNLSDIKRKFDPSNLISLQKTTSSLFDIFPIKLQDKIPSDAYLLENNLTNFVYIDTNGDLVIEVVNLKDSEIVEIEIDTSGTIFEVDES